LFDNRTEVLRKKLLKGIPQAALEHGRLMFRESIAIAASTDWEAEFDGFLSNDVKLESDILDIDEVEILEIEDVGDATCDRVQVTAEGAGVPDRPTSTCRHFQEECSMCCICWEPFLNKKQIRLEFLEKKQVMVPFALPCLHLGHLCCLKKMLSMRCTQKCCGRCAAQIPEQLFGGKVSMVFLIDV
jgi:hypothetical protein